ncbi:MAG TPA: DMT family transporter [Pseudomonadales bacterium]|nr:DMT family transporter [Pseudomonadales bacterium]
MSDGVRAHVFASVTVLFWSTVATAFKLALQVLDVFQLILYATLTAAGILLMAVMLRGEAGSLLSVLRRHWRVSLVSGALNPFIYYIVLFAAYDRLPAQVAQPINYTWAIVLTFMSIVVLKQKITGRDIGAAVVCYAGVLIIAVQGQWRTFSIADPTGVMLALLSTLVWASYWIINMRDPRPPMIALCLNFLVALPLTAVACVIMSTPIVTSTNGIAGAVYVGVFEMGLSFLLWSHALRLAENTSRVSNLVFLSPFLSLVFINRILGEPIYSTTYVGLVIIIAGLLLQRMQRILPESEVV